MKILGIETSCDETAAAVVADGVRILSNQIASQVEIHARYGGIVPEVASRQHLLAIIPIIEQAMAEQGPFLIDFVVEPEENVYPMVSPGAALTEVIEEPGKEEAIWRKRNTP